MNKAHRTLVLPAIMLLSMPNSCSADWFSGLYDSFFTTPARPATYEQTLTEREARDYIEQSMSSLEYALYRHMRDTDLSSLKRLIIDNVTRAQYAYQNNSTFTSSGKKYKKRLIDEFLASAVLTYIEETSYSYVYTRTHDRTIATRISSSMRNNALALIAQNSVVNYERLVPFVGYALEKALNDILKNNDFFDDAPVSKPTKPAPKPAHTTTHSTTDKQFPSSDCVICLEEFDNKDIIRIFLKPCGHDMCRSCVFEYFFGSTGKSICPHCRASVNLDKLQDDLL